jgi:hypothetical protein
MASIFCYAVAAYNQVTESHECTRLSTRMRLDTADMCIQAPSCGKSNAIAYVIAASAPASA